MYIGAQISLYPLGQPDLVPAIQEVWDALSEAGLRYEPGLMSTLAFGEDGVILDALKEGFRRATRQGPAVLVVTLTNACPMPEGK